MKIQLSGQIVKKIDGIIPGKISIRIGYMTRDAFIPDSSAWRKIIRNNQHINITKKTVGKFESLCNIGYISSYCFLLGTLNDEVQVETACIDFDTYSVHRTKAGDVYVCLYESVSDISEILKVIKQIVEIPCLITYKNISNSLWKEEPKHTGLHPKHLLKTNISGDWGLIYFEGSSVIISLSNKSYEISHKYPYDVRKTVLYGYWGREMFTVVSASYISGKNVRDTKIIKRIRLIKRFILPYNFCRLPDFSTIDQDKAILFISQKGMRIYRPPNEISFVFSVEKQDFHGMTLFKLTHQEDIFEGTSEFPIRNPLPLSREDRDFLALLSYPTNNIEFRWVEDNLTPYTVSNSRSCNYEKDWNILHKITLFKKTYPNSKSDIMAQTKSLKMLPVNKSVVFYSPLEGDDVLVRTGTIGEGSCLFHALLHAYSKDYSSMDRKGRMKFVKRLRASMAGNIDEESWEEMGNGIISKIPFQENTHDILESFYDFIGKSESGEIKGRGSRRVIKKLLGDDKKLKLVYYIFTEIFSFSELTSNMLPTIYSETEDKKIDDVSKRIIEYIAVKLKNTKEISTLDMKKISYIIEKISNMMKIILGEAKNIAYSSYIKGLERVSEDVDTYTIEFISERFNRDVYFLDGTSRLPYNICHTNENIKNRKSMIVLWVGKNHYEIVGKLLPGNKILRDFPPDDDLINKIRTFTIEPEKIQTFYPELSKYAPSEFRDAIPESKQNISDDESMSDKYYDSSDQNSDDD